MKRWMPYVVALLLVAVAFLTCACQQENTPAEPDFGTVYAQAQELGYNGSIEELVALFKGDSAYQVAQNNGYTGSEQEWLASLVGQSGDTPLVGENGNWWVSGLDTGVSAQGPQGEAGRGIDRIRLTAAEGNEDTYTIYYTDGTTQTFVVTNGKDGIDGVNGQAGAPGKGIVDIRLTQSEDGVDTYTITFSDNTTQTYTVANGKAGKDGKGIDDIALTSSQEGVDIYTITYTDGSTQTYTVTNGKDGETGKNGKDGKANGG